MRSFGLIRVRARDSVGLGLGLHVIRVVAGGYCN